MASRPFIAFDSKIQRRAESAIAHGALTNSKRPSSHVRGFYPTHLSHGKGAFVWDTRGNRYIDFICGLGSSILGYSNEEVNLEISHRMHLGATLSLGTVTEVECAEKVKEVIPFAEKVRFLKTGSDACTAAIRIARAKTGRSLVLSEGYHGWHDEFCVAYNRKSGNQGLGLNEESQVFPFIDEIRLDSVAAVIVEPVVTDLSKERIAFLQLLRERCNKSGTLLIFDEVITGFRFPKLSASEYFGIEPDLICMGKAMGNGMPISCVAGKSDIMECEDYFVSSTFAGETLSLAAATKTISLLQTKYLLDHLWDKGTEFLYRFNSIAPELVRIDGYPTRGVFRGEKMNTTLFFQESCRAGILFGPSFFFNFSHRELIDPVISACQDILMKIRTGSVELEGDFPIAPLAQKVRAA